MAYVTAVPDVIAAAATDVAAIGSTVNAAHLAAASPTVAVIPAAADEVSAGIAHLFSVHAQGFQALAGQAAVFQDQLVQHLNASAGSYAAAEAANVASLQPLISSATAAATTLPPQLTDVLTSFWATVNLYIAVFNSIAFLAVNVLYLSLFLAFLTLVLEILTALTTLYNTFGLFFPLLIP